MSDSTPGTPSPEEPPTADALRAEIASARAELTRAAEQLDARLARHTRSVSEADPVDEQRVGEQPTQAPATDETPAEAEPAFGEPPTREPAPTSTRHIIREPAVVSDRIEILPAPGRNLPALRPVAAQRGLVAGLALAAVVYLLTRRRRRF